MQRNCFYLVRVFCLLLSLVLMGCSNPAPQPGQTVTPTDQTVTSTDQTSQPLKILLTNKLVYDTTFKTLALLDSRGKLSPGVKSKAIQLGNAYMTLHNMAVQTLLDGTPVSITNVLSAFDLFMQYVKPYTSTATIKGGV